MGESSTITIATPDLGAILKQLTEGAQTLFSKGPTPPSGPSVSSSMAGATGSLIVLKAVDHYVLTPIAEETKSPWVKPVGLFGTMYGFNKVLNSAGTTVGGMLKDIPVFSFLTNLVQVPMGMVGNAVDSDSLKIGGTLNSISGLAVPVYVLAAARHIPELAVALGLKSIQAAGLAVSFGSRILGASGIASSIAGRVFAYNGVIGLGRMGLESITGLSDSPEYTLTTSAHNQIMQDKIGYWPNLLVGELATLAFSLGYYASDDVKNNHLSKMTGIIGKLIDNSRNFGDSVEKGLAISLLEHSLSDPSSADSPLAGQTNWAGVEKRLSEFYSRDRLNEKGVSVPGSEYMKTHYKDITELGSFAPDEVAVWKKLVTENGTIRDMDQFKSYVHCHARILIQATIGRYEATSRWLKTTGEQGTPEALPIGTGMELLGFVAASQSVLQEDSWEFEKSEKVHPLYPIVTHEISRREVLLKTLPQSPENEETILKAKQDIWSLQKLLGLLKIQAVLGDFNDYGHSDKTA